LFGPEKHEVAATLVGELANGSPVRAVTVAKRMDLNPACGAASALLTRAAATGLVRRVGRSLWVPIREGEEN